MGSEQKCCIQADMGLNPNLFFCELYIPGKIKYFKAQCPHFYNDNITTFPRVIERAKCRVLNK